ncbi:MULTISPECIES: NAD(P)-dependent methylenetetrahydromethanopterin dehydrogenase [Methylomonas]|uniref:Methylenetetrahydromethanopterin dehydrogenase n=1 Tax=Methylomonas koyamae TaxID=702114 RepID=A0A291IMK8_9GAMM|nr:MULTISPECIES: NAD(P)-dependent methylenetetrahydromethanopterin dehydrogenase [Methylomonas]ANE56478.1 methylenetetrahydromethanopterin dehydrogenase [Methylomonas sp. DH-1]ATG91436.1 methylenetetrahydromethanopterin dehydrogenase [Methylomonas koyamae]OAI26828.1 methylenetetrahydromethanopterin dehydrogenase [Methylomonas koyamae]WNB77027.1 methylenetetrahydromethanopterin dehydrogenase [Methylomonas koyamae]
MAKRSILHMFDPMPNNSPFDINMALDAGFDVLVPYANVKLENIHNLTQDAVFSRSPAGNKRTALFIGGRDMGLAIDMLQATKPAMAPPFQVSVFADPSGACTTAAALVACVEKALKDHHSRELKGLKALVFGGTGPVGIATGVIASLQGAETLLVDHLSIDSAKDAAKQYNRRFGASMGAAVARNDEEKAQLVADADIVFCTAKAGIRVINSAVLAQAKQLKVAGDVNAVPPLGIEGIELNDFAAPLAAAAHSPNAVGVGALAVGNVKYQLQHELLKLMLETETPLFLDFREAFVKARTLV